MAAGGLAPPHHHRDLSADGEEISLTTEVLNRVNLEARSVFVYGFIESDSLLPQTTQLLQVLEKKCGPVAGAFRFFKRAPPGYDRGEYMSAVFLIVFETTQAATGALRLRMERVGDTLINVRPASSKHKSHAAAQRILESFLPIDERAAVREPKGGKRRWAPDDFSPSDRLWVVVIWGNSTYTVDWRAARAAAQRYDAVIIDDAAVMLPYTDPTLIATQPAQPGGSGYWDVELYDDGFSRHHHQGDGGDSSFRPSFASESRRERSPPGHQQRYVRRESSLGSPSSSPQPPVRRGSGNEDRFRSAQQRYYDEKYGRVDYSLDPYNDYGIRGDFGRLTRYGFRCVRSALRSVRETWDRMTTAEQPLRTDHEGRDDEGNGHKSVERGQRERRDGEDRRGRSRGTTSPEDLAVRAANAERTRREEEENERVRQGGLRRRYGGLELRRPHPVEASLVWMPGIQYVRPVMNLLGFWTEDEDRGDGRAVRSRHEDSGHRAGLPSSSWGAAAGAATSSATGVVPRSSSLRYPSGGDYALESGRAVYPGLVARRGPTALSDFSRLNAGNIDVVMPTRRSPEDGVYGVTMAAYVTHNKVTPPTGGAHRKRVRSDSFLGKGAESAGGPFPRTVSGAVGQGERNDGASGGTRQSNPESRGDSAAEPQRGSAHDAHPADNTGSLSSTAPPSSLSLQQSLLRSALARTNMQDTTPGTALDPLSAPFPSHKPGRIRILSVQPSVQASAINPVSDVSVSEMGHRRSVSFALPGAQQK